MVAFRAVLALVTGAAAAAASPDWNAEAADVRNMMEGVKRHSAPRSQPTTVTNAHALNLAGLDEQLFKHADEDLANLKAMNAADSSKKKTKKAVLAAQHQSQEKQEDRAARFFATHGMGRVGRMLGEGLSASELKKAQGQEARAQHRLQEIGAASTGKHALRASKAAAKVSVASADDDSDDAGSIDEEEQAQQQRWKAVDALRHRMPHF